MKQKTFWLMIPVCISIVGILFLYNRPGLQEQGITKSTLQETNNTGMTKMVPISTGFKEELSSKAVAIMQELKVKFALDTVRVKRERCDEENAFYDPETQSITMCDEIVDKMYTYALSAEKDPKAQHDIALHSILFFFLHELGHAYIHLYDLPITGREEDVADQIATYMILTLQKDAGFDWVADGAFTFYRYSEESPDIDDEVLADVHSLDKQRFYNIACWLYGASQDKSIITDRGLSEERAEGCSDEYSLMKSSLDRLLKN